MRRDAECLECPKLVSLASVEFLELPLGDHCATILGQAGPQVALGIRHKF